MVWSYCLVLSNNATYLRMCRRIWRGGLKQPTYSQKKIEINPKLGKYFLSQNSGKQKLRLNIAFLVLKLCLGNLAFTWIIAPLQSTTLIDALLLLVQSVVLVFILLLWSVIISFIKPLWSGLLHNQSFVKGSHYLSLWSRSAWNAPLTFLFEHMDLTVIPCSSFNQEPAHCGCWEVTSFLAVGANYFWPLYFSCWYFNCVLRAKTPLLQLSGAT